MKTYVVGTHQKRLSEALPMRTHSILFSALSGVMTECAEVSFYWYRSYVFIIKIE